MYPRHRDPDYAAFEDQVKLYRKFHGNWPEALAKDLVKAWNVQRDKFKSVPYPWQYAKGPVGALQCYLLEHGWSFDKQDEWVKPGHNGEPNFKLNMNADWFYLRQELERAHRWEASFCTRYNNPWIGCLGGDFPEPCPKHRMRLYKPGIKGQSSPNCRTGRQSLSSCVRTVARKLTPSMSFGNVQRYGKLLRFWTKRIDKRSNTG